MRNYLLIIGAIFSVGLLTGCDTASTSAGSEFCASSGLSCTGGGTIEACANSSDAWYELNGSYYCSYQSSSTCASRVVDACSAKTTPENGKLMEQLLQAKIDYAVAVQDNMEATLESVSK